MDDSIACWRKSSHSSANGGQCIEVGTIEAGRVAGIRDSKSPECGHLAVTPRTFSALLRAIKRGELGLTQVQLLRRRMLPARRRNHRATRLDTLRCRAAIGQALREGPRNGIAAAHHSPDEGRRHIGMTLTLKGPARPK